MATFSTKDETSDAKERVKTIIIDLIKDPNVSRIDDMLQFPAVSQLKEDSSYSKLFRLFEIFAKEGATQYLQIYQQDPTYFTETLGLVHDESLTKIRLLTLVSLASSKDTISYSEVAQATGLCSLNISFLLLKGVDKGDVEVLVVEAITRGYLDARLDQLHTNVVIRHAEPRSYDQQHWQRLDNRLAKWKSNLAGVIDVIRNAKTQLAEGTKQ